MSDTEPAPDALVSIELTVAEINAIENLIQSCDIEELDADEQGPLRSAASRLTTARWSHIATTRPKRPLADLAALRVLVDDAWGIICAAGLKTGGGWDSEDPEWVAAAERWRERFHASLGLKTGPVRSVEEIAAEQEASRARTRSALSKVLGDQTRETLEFTRDELTAVSLALSLTQVENWFSGFGRAMMTSAMTKVDRVRNAARS